MAMQAKAICVLCQNFYHGEFSMCGKNNERTQYIILPMEFQSEFFKLSIDTKQKLNTKIEFWLTKFGWHS